MSNFFEQRTHDPQIAFFSVLYNPSANAVANIRRSIESGFTPYVYINRADDGILRELRSLPVFTLGTNENVGLGPAFHHFEKLAIDRHIPYFIYFDQDTVVEESAWARIGKTFLQEFDNPGIGLLYYTANRKLPSSPKVAISSGCLFSLDVIRRTGEHDPTYFVEGVDYEFCLRLREEGLRIQTVFIDGIDHLSLQDGITRNIAGIDFKLRYYGLERLRDFNKSHGKLILRSIRARDYTMAKFFIESAVKFNIKNIFSKIALTGR